MSVQAALSFIESTASDDALRARIRGLEGATGLDELVRLAGTLGYRFSETEFRAAFRIDWEMRARHFSHVASGERSSGGSNSDQPCATER